MTKEPREDHSREIDNKPMTRLLIAMVIIIIVAVVLQTLLSE